VTPIGIGEHEFFQGWVRSRRGIRTISHFDAEPYPVRIAGEIDVDPSPWLSARELKKMDRFAVLAVIAADLAIEQSGLLDADCDRSRVGTFIGSGIGGSESWLDGASAVVEGRGPRVSPRLLPNGMANSAGALVTIRHGLTGPSVSPSSACSSGSDALVQAVQAIRSGEVLAAVAGGVDCPVTPPLVGGFSNLHALSQRNDDPEHASRPFSADRDGFVLAEGAGVLVLEEKEAALNRGATVLAELLGYGRSSDAFHITRPSEEGDGAQLAMRRALDDSGIAPPHVDLVSAHGTATIINDATETNAIAEVFGDDPQSVPVSSIKGLIGHTLGASGSIAAIAAVQSLVSGLAPGTANLTSPDPTLRELNYIGEGTRRLDPKVVLVNSNAFGGHNVSILFAACPR
jgi:3-oxoacyl-[acyl-carrier-protein] synthase II